MTKLSSKPRARRSVPSHGDSKVPLTFYRSRGGGGSAPKSPFEKIIPGKKTGPRHFIVRLLDFAVLLFIVFILGYSLLVTPHPTVLLDSDIYHSEETYVAAATQQFRQLKNRTKLTLDDRQIIKSLQKKYPEISAARIELPLFSQTPKIHIVVGKPSFFLNSKGTSYLVNSKGVAVNEVAKLPAIKNLPMLIDQTGFEISPGKQVLSEDNIRFIGAIIAQCNKAKIPISSLTLPPLAQELDLRTSDRPYFVKFHLGGESSLQIGQFLASRQQFDSSNTQPSEYLDVRVNGKIFYK